MKITIVYDNTVMRADLIPDWGFSCLVEVYGRTILFDTGANGSILLENMMKLHIDPRSIEEVFISHDHYDHTGGLVAFLKQNDDVKIYAPFSLKKTRHAKEFICVHEPMRMHENIFSTGELDSIEQSLAVKTEKGVVVVVGCSHPTVKVVLDAAAQFGRVCAIVGGFHGFDDYELLSDVQMVCPTHCTQHIPEIKSLYPEKYIAGGAGAIIEV
ncbi:MBL fold metallo-hydrolase [bacterium]|nr:MBL fold metallo-hydrolase [bacterium]